MKYPDDFIGKIIHGDCLQVMRQMPGRCVDMILVDPPYGKTARNPWDVVIPPDQMWETFRRVIKPNAAVLVMAMQPFASDLVVSNRKMFRYDLVWEKNKASGFLNAKKMPLRRHELIMVFYGKPPVYHPQKSTGHRPVNWSVKGHHGTNYGELKSRKASGGQTDRHPSSILYFPVLNNDSPERIHPTQKPVELFEYLIRTFTDEGMVVLDSCIGSGTTAQACLNSNRQFIGIDVEKKFVDMARKRVGVS